MRSDCNSTKDAGSWRLPAKGFPCRISRWIVAVLLIASGSAVIGGDEQRSNSVDVALMADAQPKDDEAELSYSFPWPVPDIPRHHDHIRIAALAYGAQPSSDFEVQLLKEHIDLVIGGEERIKQISPATPVLTYTNVSSLYLGLLTDWLNFADYSGHAREAAFFHVREPIAFVGTSPSSLPVKWFWAAYRVGTTVIDYTSRVQTDDAVEISIGNNGETLYLGYPDRFGEINFQLKKGAAHDWSAQFEYPYLIPPDGENELPTVEWKPLPLSEDQTDGFQKSGKVIFAPPADWCTAKVVNSAGLFYLRIHTKGTGNSPLISQLFAADYVNSIDRYRGTIPVYDYDADEDGNGYLDDVEWTKRKPECRARFEYQSRFFAKTYGQMRFATNPANAAFQDWAVDFHRRRLKQSNAVDGLFFDNSSGLAMVKQSQVHESIAHYSIHYGTLVNKVVKSISPKFAVLNTVGGNEDTIDVVKQNPFYIEEFAIRPMRHSYVEFERVCTIVSSRSKAMPGGVFGVIDSHPLGGSPRDGRTQLGTLAAYYMLADPDQTFLMFYGGSDPATNWREHWCEAVKFDVGKPLEKMSVVDEGNDPANPELRYRVYKRAYQHALVFFKPLAHDKKWKVRASIGDNSVTSYPLKGKYRALWSDNITGKVIEKIDLRNGEGAILVPVTE